MHEILLYNHLTAVKVMVYPVGPARRDSNHSCAVTQISLQIFGEATKTERRCGTNRAIVYKKDDASCTFRPHCARRCSGKHGRGHASRGCRFGRHAKPLLLLELRGLAFTV